MIWKDNSIYEGDYLMGRKDGKGKFTFPSGNVYDGYWIDGKQHGAGTLYSKDEKILKKGLWKFGLFDR